MEVSLTIALRYILELLKAGNTDGAMRELESMITQAQSHDIPNSHT